MARALVLLLLSSCARTEPPHITPTPIPVVHVSPPPPLAIASAVAPSLPTAPFTLLDDRDRPIEVYPPIVKKPHAPLVVFLHATCMQPASVCNWFGNAGRDPGWLVCPSGNSTCYGEPDWNGTGTEKAAFLASALARVDASVPNAIDAAPGVLIGWSRGAFAARDILDVPSMSSRFHALVLIAAHVSPQVAKLKKAGIQRVVMAAGDFDGSKPVMMSAVSSLKAGGLEARFVSLGKIGHVWPEDFETRMSEPIAWAAAAK